ncbi:MAG: tetratricopeptide repeat protein [Acidobacteria bacterium]|nr:tetratricopeptide repeat protein [Acidobacteriota bacterium]
MTHAVPPPARSTRPRRTIPLAVKALLPYALLVAAGLAVYGNSLWFDYTYFDDHELIFNNQYFFDDLSNIGALFMDDMWRFTEDTYYRPLYMLTYMLDFQFTGTDMFGYHLSSVIIHLLSACLLTVLFGAVGFSRRLSLWGALIFVVHPVHVQGVSWIPGRNDSLLGLSVIVATLAWAWYWKAPGRGRWALQAGTFFCALLIKEPAFVLPPLLLGLVWARESHAVFLEKARARWVAVASGWVAAALSWFVLRWLAFDNPAPVVPRLLDNISQTGLVLIHYFGKTVFPVSLRTVADLHAPLWPGLVVLAGIAAALYLVRPGRMLWVGVSWFALMVFPTLLAGHDFYLEERLYAPMVGMLLFLLFVLETTRFHATPIGRGLLSAVVLLFLVVGFNRSQQFADRWSLWESAVVQSPQSAFAANNLGAMYFLDERYDDARVQYERALALDPTEPMVRDNLGQVHHVLEEFETAATYYQAEIQHTPWYANSHHNLGILWAQLNRFEDAVREWETAIEVDPDYAAPYEMLARYYRNQNNPERFNHYVSELRRLGMTFE